MWLLCSVTSRVLDSLRPDTRSCVKSHCKGCRQLSCLPGPSVRRDCCWRGSRLVPCECRPHDPRGRGLGGPAGCRPGNRSGGEAPCPLQHADSTVTSGGLNTSPRQAYACKGTACRRQASRFSRALGFPPSPGRKQVARDRTPGAPCCGTAAWGKSWSGCGGLHFNRPSGDSSSAPGDRAVSHSVPLTKPPT